MENASHKNAKTVDEERLCTAKCKGALNYSQSLPAGLICQAKLWKLQDMNKPWFPASPLDKQLSNLLSLVSLHYFVFLD